MICIPARHVVIWKTMNHALMRIIIVNGSHRKNGATALILTEMYHQLKKYSDVIYFQKRVLF